MAPLCSIKQSDWMQTKWYFRFRFCHHSYAKMDFVITDFIWLVKVLKCLIIAIAKTWFNLTQKMMPCMEISLRGKISPPNGKVHFCHWYFYMIQAHIWHILVYYHQSKCLVMSGFTVPLIILLSVCWLSCFKGGPDSSIDSALWASLFSLSPPFPGGAGTVSERIYEWRHAKKK